MHHISRASAKLSARCAEISNRLGTVKLAPRPETRRRADHAFNARKIIASATENVGIPPDIEVEHDPALVRKGQDPQLEKAIEVVMQKLVKNPVPTPKRPAYPRHNKKPPSF